MSFFFPCLSFFFKLRERERERERVYKIGYREKQSQSYLSYLDRFQWRIFLLLRANRLYPIFNTGLKKMALSCPRYFFVFFYPEYLALVLSPTNPIQQLTFFFSISANGVPANRLASTFPCQATRVRSPSINIWSPL